MNKFSIYSFYRFVNVENKINIKKVFDLYFKNKLVRGTILLADEGINGSIASDKKSLDETVIFIKKQLKIRKINIKKNHVDFLPFNKLKVRLKKEIVTLGINKLKNFDGNYLPPSEWNSFMLNKKTKIIDVRNNYEIEIGTFKNAINPKTKNFRDFPSQFSKLKINKTDTIGIYCTGGIRCEKAANYLSLIGYRNVYQLEGGIINYLNHKKKSNLKSNWIGECFVFDDRVSINKNLDKGKYYQCYGCRSAITHEEMQSRNYKKGIYCPKCYNLRSEKQIKSSEARQKQIELNRKRKVKDKFQKIYSL